MTNTNKMILNILYGKKVRGNVDGGWTYRKGSIWRGGAIYDMNHLYVYADTDSVNKKKE